jgi:hypothetical protein
MTVAKETVYDRSSKNSSSGFTITIKRLVELYESEDDEDEYGVLKPSNYAFKTAVNLVLEAHSILGKSFPKASACTDDRGGVSLTWTSIQPARKVRLFCPFTDEPPIRIYHRQGDERGSENVISVATLVDRLKWFNQE